MSHVYSELESESIEIIREVAATARKPVMLYSIGKDSSVMLRLAQKAFYPAPIPFPLMHIDTGWKFREMIAFRERTARQIGFELITYTNPRGVAEGIGPITHGSAYHTDVMKTEALKQAIDLHGFDFVFGGARRDEEKSRAKERIFSFRALGHRWDPKAQRPELWNLYNTRINAGETVRVFPLSNWTEADVWFYIYLEKIPIVPLYFAKEHNVVIRGGSIVVAYDKWDLLPGEKTQRMVVRMRSLGCVPCTGAIRSTADTVPKIIEEMISFRRSERENRVIDHDEEGSMEIKKREGYF